MLFQLRTYTLVGVCLAASPARTQCDRWQQHVKYAMDVRMDVTTHRYDGTTTLTYRNNSPDTLRELYFHLYPNAFRPGSEMDVRSRTIVDPDDRVGSRIAELQPGEMGKLEVGRMTQQGHPVGLEHMGTVLRARLQHPILPGKSTSLNIDFTGQVPVQIRRSGRNNAEGVAYSMTQWYPKVAHYDHRGWHAYPYVGREFHGVWGDFDLRLTIDSSYTVAATGVLQNAEEIGHGYASGKKSPKRPQGDQLTWHFVARDVHDIAWAADPDYVHFSEQVPGGPVLHFFHKNEPELVAVWKELPAYMMKALAYMNEHFGRYPWPQYSFVQGGDGGMEYPMLTLVTGRRRLGSLVGVSVHEFVHSWYHGMLATNEGRFAWMDEGMTQYASSKVMQELFPRPEPLHAAAYRGYASLVESGRHEPPIIHADHFLTNMAYGVSAYNFGELFIHQMGAVVGEKNLADGLLRYTKTCSFKHPEPIDLERVLEKQSGLELDWYFDEWVGTTRTLDYAIHSILDAGGRTEVVLERKGQMLMPVDLQVRHRDGTTMSYHIPLSLMRGPRAPDNGTDTFTALPAWQWTDLRYSFMLPLGIAEVDAIVLDPQHRLADMDRENDVVLLPQGSGGMIRP